jgi:hypothetical protein
MATTSNRTITIVNAGDTTATEIITADPNVVAPGAVELRNLAIGFNSFNVPTGGSVPVAVTIVPPAGNTVQITLKGITGDTGVLLHLTQPSSIAIAPAQTTIGLTAAATVTGVRFYWT